MQKFICLLLVFISITAHAQNLKSGGVIKPEQAIMDIRHYTIALDVDPEQKNHQWLHRNYTQPAGAFEYFVI